MAGGLQRLGASLPQILLVATVIELAVYRIAVQLLEPTTASARASLPAWHQALAYLGLFVFYFASIFAAFVVVVLGLSMLRQSSGPPKVLRFPLSALVVGVAALALVASVVVPTSDVSFFLEATFAASILVLLATQVVTRGEIGAKVGLLLFAAPLVVHFAGQFAIRYVSGEEGLWTGVLDNIEQLGHWLLILAAVAAPYCFSPKPFADSAARLEPLVAGAFAGLIGAIVIRENYKVGAELAATGLGIRLGPAAPMSLIALHLMALAAITWTLLACLLSPAPARRQIGVGIGLVAVGGYSFNWPLQFLTGLVGLFTIATAAAVVKGQERTLRRPMKFQSPAISARVWQGYLDKLLAAMRLLGKDDGDDDARPPSMVTVREDDVYRSYLVGRVGETPFRVQVLRYQTSESEEEDEMHAAIASIDVLCGPELEEGGEPLWTLYSPGASRKSGNSHPQPPVLDAEPKATGDEEFDGRFEVRERSGSSDVLDAEMRQRCLTHIDGWVAAWTGGTVAYRVCPGQGAPLDAPIPISQLSFRAESASVDNLVAVVELLAAIAQRLTEGDAVKEELSAPSSQEQDGADQ